MVVITSDGASHSGTISLNPGNYNGQQLATEIQTDTKSFYYSIYGNLFVVSYERSTNVIKL